MAERQSANWVQIATLILSSIVVLGGTIATFISSTSKIENIQSDIKDLERDIKETKNLSQQNKERIIVITEKVK